MIRTGKPVLLSLALLGVLAVTPSLLAQAKQYQTAEEAYRVGIAFTSSKNFAASQEPLEAALKLAPDDAFRFKVYEALVPAYRLLPESDKMIEAVTFILAKSTRDAEKSLYRSSLLSFLYQRGKLDAAVERFEKDLKKDPNDQVALFLLSEIYGGRMKPNPARSAELTERLGKLGLKENKPLDVRTTAKLADQYVKSGKVKEGAELFEKLAQVDAKLSAWHYKEAAQAWLKANDKKRALAAARSSATSDGEKRSEQLTYFWHAQLGDVFLTAGDPAAAVKQLEEAIKHTTIDGYLKDCQQKLAKAREQASKVN